MLHLSRFALSEGLLHGEVPRSARGGSKIIVVFSSLVSLGVALFLLFLSVISYPRDVMVVQEPAITMAWLHRLPAKAWHFQQLARAWPAKILQPMQLLRGPQFGQQCADASTAAARADPRLAADLAAFGDANVHPNPAARRMELNSQLKFFQGEAPHLGLHIVAEFFLADFDALDNAEALEGAMRSAAEYGNATILSSHAHRFEPHGVSSVVIIQESNLCIHTWPEFGYAAADIFTCGDTVDPWKSFEYLNNFLKAQKVNFMELRRGSTELINNPNLLADMVDKVGHPHMLKGQQFLREREAHTDTEINTGLLGEPLFSTRSKFQKIVIAKNKWWGNMLYIDDCLNVAARDEFIYHEMIAHVPMMVHPDPRRVLIIGGGDGGSAREVLRHPNLEKVVMVDIDETVVESCKKYMPEVSQGAFDNPKLELVIGDGIEFVRKAADHSWDVIIVDSTDPSPDSAGEVLFSPEFYENVRRTLAPNGVVSTQSLMPMRFEPKLYNESLKNLRHSFGMAKTWIYLLPADAYNGQQSFGFGFKDGVHPQHVDKARVKQFCIDNKLKYYNYDIHLSSFCLPTYLKESLGLVKAETFTG